MKRITKEDFSAEKDDLKHREELNDTDAIKNHINGSIILLSFSHHQKMQKNSINF